MVGDNGLPPDPPEEPNDASGGPEEQPEPGLDERIRAIMREEQDRLLERDINPALAKIAQNLPTTEGVAAKVVEVMRAEWAPQASAQNGAAPAPSDARERLEGAGAQEQPTPEKKGIGGLSGEDLLRAAKEQPLQAFDMVFDKFFTGLERFQTMKAQQNPIETGRKLAADYPELAPLFFPDAMDAQIPSMMAKVGGNTYTAGFRAGLTAGRGGAEAAAKGGVPAGDPFVPEFEPGEPLEEEYEPPNEEGMHVRQHANGRTRPSSVADVMVHVTPSTIANVLG